MCIICWDGGRLFESVIGHTTTRLLLFFPNTPLTYDASYRLRRLGADAYARLFGWLILRMKSAVRSGQLILGVETLSMRDSLTSATDVQSTYLPHPAEN